MTSDTQGYAVALWVLLGLFVLRVAGQLLIAMGAGGFLPPWEEWFSGALPYPALLTSQLLILFLYGAIARDVTPAVGSLPCRGAGSVRRCLHSDGSASRASIETRTRAPRSQPRW